MEDIYIDDIVIVIGSKSIPAFYLGQYGKVTDVYHNDDKLKVEFYARVSHKGSLSHTALRSDLKKVEKV